MSTLRPSVDAAIRATERYKRLCAAAPEMYELFKRLQNLFEGDDIKWEEGALYILWRDALSDIVAKVEGDEQKEKHDEPR